MLSDGCVAEELREACDRAREFLTRRNPRFVCDEDSSRRLKNLVHDVDRKDSCALQAILPRCLPDMQENTIDSTIPPKLLMCTETKGEKDGTCAYVAPTQEALQTYHISERARSVVSQLRADLELCGADNDPGLWRPRFEENINV